MTTTEVVYDGHCHCDDDDGHCDVACRLVEQLPIEHDGDCDDEDDENEPVAVEDPEVQCDVETTVADYHWLPMKASYPRHWLPQQRQLERPPRWSDWLLHSPMLAVVVAAEIEPKLQQRRLVDHSSTTWTSTTETKKMKARDC